MAVISDVRRDDRLTMWAVHCGRDLLRSNRVPSDDSTVLVCKLAVLLENQGQEIGRKVLEALVAEFPGTDFGLTVSDTYLKNGPFHHNLGSSKPTMGGREWNSYPSYAQAGNNVNISRYTLFSARGFRFGSL
jgi:hypothetical protein